MDDAQSNPLDQVWRALADPTRRGLLDLLRTGPKTTGQLVEAVPALTRFGVMKHLGVLEEAGLLTVSRQGRQRFNHLNAVPLRQVYERWVSKYEDTWAGSLLSLKRLAERKEQAMSVKLTEAPARVAHVETEISINAKPGTVYTAFTEDFAEWFYESEESKKTRPAHFEAKLGGRVYVKDQNGKENMMATVNMIQPGKKMRLKGDFTMPQAFIANVTIEFHEDGAGTRVHISHRMAGEFYDEMPSEFEEGWQDGLQKLKQLVEA
ncbi:MAG: SRPBCC domain-containing protein [Phycisphaerales bacterium]|nr:SRPBCC domain-containing protein [Phycisphaerales bacterium]MCB9836948.1 SRPBCC domain-containing protein [Phycisphaera sp.]